MGYVCSGKGLYSCFINVAYIIRFYLPNAISDIDECSSWPCHTDATCNNTAGSYSCDCNPGYTGNGFTCTSMLKGYQVVFLITIPFHTLYTDINECDMGSANCDGNAACNDTDGSYECFCNTGFSGDGFVCSSEVIIIFHAQ